MARNMKYTTDKPVGGAVEEVYIEGLPSGGGGTDYSGTAPINVSGSTISLTKAAHVADATNETDVVTQFNALLDALEAAGIVATA